MRVIIVTGHARPSAYFEHALVELRRREVDAHLMTTVPRGSLHDRVAALDVPAHTLLSGRAVGVLRAADVVHAHEPLPALEIFPVAALASSALRLLHRHHGRSRGRLRTAARAAAAIADGVLTVSSYGADQARACERVRPERIRAVLNGVDVGPMPPPERIAAMRSALGIADDELVVVVMARLRAEKGHAVLLAALERIVEPLASRLHVVLVGDGPLRDEIAVAAARIGRPRVQLVGHQADPWPWYALGDMCVVPSLEESFGLVAAEAMGSGRAVVASAVGGLLEILSDGVDGVLVTPGSADELAAAISNLAVDAAWREQLGERARRHQQSSLTVPAMVDRWLSAYRELGAEQP